MKIASTHFVSILFVIPFFISSCGILGSDDSSETSFEGNWEVVAGFTDIKYMSVNLDSNTFRIFFDRIPPTDDRPECYYVVEYDFYNLDGNTYQVDPRNYSRGHGDQEGKIEMRIDNGKLIIRGEDAGMGNFELNKTERNLEDIYICN